jgi:hypothetical protein
MIARVTALTGLEFDAANVKSVLKANPDGEVYDSSKGWLIDEWFPHERVVLSPVAIDHGYFLNTPNRAEVHINERVHWTVLKKLGRPCTINGVANTPSCSRKVTTCSRVTDGKPGRKSSMDSPASR